MSARRSIGRAGHVGGVLDRSWLMGVRRGWLSLLKPEIKSWSDVIRAFDALLAFVDNLRDQVTFVRRAPAMAKYNEGAAEQERAKRAFLDVRSSIVDERRRAANWVHNFERWGDRDEDVVRAFNAYQKDFGGTLRAFVEKRGQGTRSVSITELLDKLLAILRKDAEQLRPSAAQTAEQVEEAWGRGVYTDYDLHGLKVVLEDKTRGLYGLTSYLRRFDEAHALLKRKGLGSVWRGVIVIRCEDCGGENPNGPEYTVGADYHIAKDIITIYERPNRGLVRMIAHELGHRYWFKHMTESQRQKFGAFVRVKRGPGRRREWGDDMPRVSADGVDYMRQLNAITKYGASNIDEAFAEVFAAYVFGEDLSHNQIELFRDVIPDSRAGHVVGVAKRRRSK